ncbi:MAG TPA: sigma-70 family RNA polymerase sigma factor [Polyangia bacterium]
MAERSQRLRDVPRDLSRDVHESLWQALSTGVPGASHAVWQAFSPSVHRLLRRLLGPDGEIQDLAQEVFLRFFQRSARVTSSASLRPFLFSICSHVAQEEMRRRRIRRWLLLTDGGVLPEQSFRGDDDVARDAVRRLYRMLERLRPADRSLFTLRFIEQFELTEVAEIHALSFATARRRIDRVWKRMRGLIEKDEALRAYLSPEQQEGRHGR